MGGPGFAAVTLVYICIALTLAATSGTLLLFVPCAYYPRRNRLMAAQRVLRSAWLLVRRLLGGHGHGRAHAGLLEARASDGAAVARTASRLTRALPPHRGRPAWRARRPTCGRGSCAAAPPRWLPSPRPRPRRGRGSCSRACRSRRRSGWGAARVGARWRGCPALGECTAPGLTAALAAHRSCAMASRRQRTGSGLPTVSPHPCWLRPVHLPIPPQALHLLLFSFPFRYAAPVQVGSPVLSGKVGGEGIWARLDCASDLDTAPTRAAPPPGPAKPDRTCPRRAQVLCVTASFFCLRSWSCALSAVAPGAATRVCAAAQAVKSVAASTLGAPPAARPAGAPGGVCHGAPAEFLAALFSALACGLPVGRREGRGAAGQRCAAPAAELRVRLPLLPGALSLNASPPARAPPAASIPVPSGAARQGGAPPGTGGAVRAAPALLKQPPQQQRRRRQQWWRWWRARWGAPRWQQQGR
jgi:hypothetical protein